MIFDQMDSSIPIHDLFIKKLKTIEENGRTRLPVLGYDDHLLRRFGYVETLRIEPMPVDSLQVRAVADEIWTLMEGKVRFLWKDLRSTSPTQGMSFEIIASEPTLVLAPFGVAFGVEALEHQALLIRLATHTDGVHEKDRTVPWEAE
jgi:hypothetical protein